MSLLGGLASATVGAALGAGAAELAGRLPGQTGAVASGLGLVTAAAIYPAARRGRGAGLGVEVAVLAASAALVAVAQQSSFTTGRRLVAGGWAAHAIFDLARGRTGDSRLPSWYPALCAGYDVAYAARAAV